MQLKTEQVQKFVELHKEIAGFEKFSEDETRQIANGVANYYYALFQIQNRINKEKVTEES